MCLTNPLTKVMQYMVNIQTYKHISEKRISGSEVRCFQNKFQGNGSVLGNVAGCGYLTAIGYQNFQPAGKVSFLFFKSSLLVSTKLLLWQGDWALGYHSMGLRHFSDVS